MKEKSILRTIAAWVIYPLSLVIVLIIYAAALSGKLEYKIAPAISGGGLVLLYMIAERVIPYEKRWGMTWTSFKSDFKEPLIN